MHLGKEHLPKSHRRERCPPQHPARSRSTSRSSPTTRFPWHHPESPKPHSRSPHPCAPPESLPLARRLSFRHQLRSLTRPHSLHSVSAPPPVHFLDSWPRSVHSMPARTPGRNPAKG